MSARTLALASNTTSDPRWQAVVQRDVKSDGLFYYAVATTAVYCRPSCGSRTPRPENVSFYPSTQAAERAGYRACKRCKPSGPSLADEHAAAVTRACRYIEGGNGVPTLRALAEVAGLSEYHFHRVFKAATGVTPAAYVSARRASRAQSALARGRPVTESIYEAGFSGSGRFYAAAKATLGMTPSAYKAKGKHEEIRFAVGECSLGSILVAATQTGICAVLMGDDAEALVADLQARFSKANLLGGDAAFETWVSRVVAVAETSKGALDLPLDVRGTAFQRRVWEELRKVPPGTMATYTQIANRIGSPAAARAVATACAANPIALLIPCHRVVRRGGALAGYRWGIERKEALLAREARDEAR